MLDLKGDMEYFEEHKGKCFFFNTGYMQKSTDILIVLINESLQTENTHITTTQIKK